MAKQEEKKFAAGVKKMTVEELGIELKNFRDKLYTMRSQAVTEKVENVAQFGVIRRNIARLLTEESARRISGVGAPRTPAAAPVKKTDQPSRKPSRTGAPKPAHKPVHKAAAKKATSAARPTRTIKAAGKANKAAPKRKATKAKSAK